MTEPFNSVPKCYLAQSDIVILEDMRCKGFEMLDRMKGLDLDHCKAVLRYYTYTCFAMLFYSRLLFYFFFFDFSEFWENFTGYRCP